MGAGSTNLKEIIMANIGTFTKTGNEYKGEIVTMSVQQKNVRIVPETSDNENAPSHRVFVGRAEIGAAWTKTLERRPRLSLGQARRSQLHRPDLRQPLRRRRRQELQPDLVARPPHQRRLTGKPAPPGTCRAGLRLVQASATGGRIGEKVGRLHLKRLRSLVDREECGILRTALD